MKKCLSLLLSLVLVFCMSFEATNVYAVSQADIDRLNQKNAAAQKEIIEKSIGISYNKGTMSLHNSALSPVKN